jgi:CTP:molybdopterin cytidylyltransferase MocA
VAGLVVAVLAAGAGSRFIGDTHKLTARLGDRTVVEHAVAAAIEADVGPVVVITGAVDLPLGGLACTVLHHPDWSRGQATSLQAAVRAADEQDATSLLVGLADQPYLGAASWRAVARADGGPIVVARSGAYRGTPVRLDREVWPLLPREGDVGARRLVAERPDLVTEVVVPGNPADIDTVEDLDRLV